MTTSRIREYDKGRLIRLYYCRRTTERGYWKFVKNREGIYREFYSSGMLYYKRRYKNGKKNGHGVIADFEPYHGYEKCYYRNDELHGKCIEKRPISRLGYHIDGRPVGKWRDWDTTGNLIEFTYHQGNGSEYVRGDGYISYKLNYISHGMRYVWDDNIFNMYYDLPDKDNAYHGYRIDNKTAWHYFTCFLRRIQRRIRKNSLKKLFDNLTYPRLDEFMIIMGYLPNDDIINILGSSKK